MKRLLCIIEGGDDDEQCEGREQDIDTNTVQFGLMD